MTIITEKIDVNTTGGAGAATGSAECPASLDGLLYDVYVDYHGSAPITTTVNIAFKTRGGTILALPASATDAFYMPRKAVHGPDGAPLTSYDLLALFDQVVVTVGASDELTDCVVVYLRYLK